MRHDTTRIVLYSHDALGLGHLRRNLALAHQLAHDLPRPGGAGVTGLLVAGLAPPAAFRLPPGFDWLILPGFTKDPGGYRPRRLRDTPQSLAALRSALVATALAAFAPALVIVARPLYGVRAALRAPRRGGPWRSPAPCAHSATRCGSTATGTSTTPSPPERSRPPCTTAPSSPATSPTDAHSWTASAARAPRPSS